MLCLAQEVFILPFKFTTTKTEMLTEQNTTKSFIHMSVNILSSAMYLPLNLGKFVVVLQWILHIINIFKESHIDFVERAVLIISEKYVFSGTALIWLPSWAVLASPARRQVGQELLSSVDMSSSVFTKQEAPLWQLLHFVLQPVLYLSDEINGLWLCWSMNGWTR